MTDIERRQVLEMLASGKISVNEASEILSLLGRQSTEGEPTAEKLKAAEAGGGATVGAPEPSVWKDDLYAVAEAPSGKPRWLKIRVQDLESGRNKVNISLPLALVTLALKIARRFEPDLDEALEVNGIELGSVLVEAMKQDSRGVLVDVEDAEEGEHVRIYLD